MTSSNSKLVDLLNLAIQATESGKAEWKQSLPDSFEMGLSSGSVIVDSEDGDGLRPYRFLAVDSEGRTLEMLLQEFDGDGGYADAWGEALTKLYEAARRSALNIEPVLDSLIADLKATNADKS